LISDAKEYTHSWVLANYITTDGKSRVNTENLFTENDEQKEIEQQQD